MQLGVPLVITFGLFGPAARACSCQAMTPEEAFTNYGAVFSGRVASVHFVDKKTSQAPRVIVEFTVLRAWKGVTGAKVEMHTHRRDQFCEGLTEAQLRKGKELLVYGLWISTGEWAKPVVLTTDVCSRTRPISDAAEDLAFLIGTDVVR